MVVKIIVFKHCHYVLAWLPHHHQPMVTLRLYLATPSRPNSATGVEVEIERGRGVAAGGMVASRQS